MFGFSRKTPAPPRRVAGGEEIIDFFKSPLPATLPVVKTTIDSLASSAIKQRLFLASHADLVKSELVKERNAASLRTGSWTLNGFALSDEDAVDLIRASPDTLSSLRYVAHDDSTGLWAKLTSWLKFKENRRTSGMSVVDDLGFALAVCEVVEVVGHTLAAVANAMSAQSPSIGRPLERSLAFELRSSQHRGQTHSVYLVLEVVHAAQRVATGTTTKTLKVDSTLYVHRPWLLGGLRGVAVNTSGIAVSDLPSTDVDERELRSILSKRGTFVASSVSDFVLDNDVTVTSERVATIAMASTSRLVHAANSALSSFLSSQTQRQETARVERRAEARADAIDREVEKQRAAEKAAETQYEREEARDAYALQQNQRMLEAAEAASYDRRAQSDGVYGWQEYGEYE